MIEALIVAAVLIVAAIVWAVMGYAEDPLARFKGKSPQEHVAFLVRYMRTHELTPAQVSDAWEREPPAASETPKRKGDVTAKIMYFLGAVFLFAGVGVYLQMFWDTMSSAMRIFSTLGVGMGLSMLSAIAMKEGKFEKAVLPLILMAALIECGGWFVFLHEMFPHGDDARKAALFCCGMMAFQQGMVFHAFRRDSLAFTAIMFMYGALQAALDLAGIKDQHIALLLGGSMIYTAHILMRTPNRALCTLFFALGAAWFNTGIFATIADASTERMALMGVGISICSFAMAMRHVHQHKLSGLCFFFGSGFFYAGLFDEVRHTPLELLYFGVAVAMMYGSAALQSRALLVTSVLAILGFIGYYTSEHFLNSAGWPIALMLMGLAFLGIGTMAVRIKRRYNM